MATAAKAWQKYKGQEHKTNGEQVVGISSVEHAEQQHVCSNMVEAVCGPATGNPCPGLCQPSPSVAVRDTAGAVRDSALGSGAVGADKSQAADGASSSHAAGLQPVDSSDVRSQVGDRQHSHRVEFVQSSVDPADAAARGASASHQGGAADEGLEAEQQATAADLRARVAARMRR